MPFAHVVIPFDESMPNLLDPPDNGALVYTLAPGQYADIAILWSALPDQPCQTGVNAGADELALSGTLSTVAAEDRAGDRSVQIQQATPLNDLNVPQAAKLSYTIKAIQSTNLYLFCYNAGVPVTSLSGELLLKVYS